MQEKKNTPDNNLIHINIEHYSYDQFYALLVFIYAEIIDFNVLLEMEKMISEYSVTRLIEYLKFIRKEISTIPPSTFHEDFLKTLLPEDSEITKLFGNVSFKIDDKMITTHKVFLCARSEYFNTMFAKGMLESQTNVIQILTDKNMEFGHPVENVNNLLQYIYSDKLDIDVNAAIGLLPLTTQYNMERCKHLCESIIEKEVETDTVLFVFQVARFYGADKLKEYCLSLIKKDLKKVQQTETWKTLSNQELEEIMKHSQT
eukprot:TRINITY_DN20991_c0_g1_i3.p1 TRINITY_DN20991_c0_g1~~TRINITY_DN20991_c0_g1_i3.p1  ORF type:complete len:259 (+),score=63.52 TRINITY_DN20991_c0_g1_i3:178-954(+)